MTDLSQLAKSLTKAQREAVLRGYLQHGRGCWPLRNSLVDKGIFPPGFYAPPTPLGAALRAHLKGQTDAA